MSELIGTMLAGRFLIKEKVGEGGMSVVYSGFDRRSKKTVAIKLLRAEHAADKSYIENFNNEAKTLSRLRNKYIVSIVGEGTFEGRRYIVLDYVEGRQLSELISGGIDIKGALLLFTKICQGISYAHQKGVIHNDIKPENILVTAEGEPYIADFGIAHVHEDSGAVGFGSLKYFAPERASGAVTDNRSDIYSLGILLYEMLVGRVPFYSDDGEKLALMHLYQPAEPPSMFNENIPESLSKIALKAINKEPLARYQSVRAMIDDISKCFIDPSGKYIKEEHVKTSKKEEQTFPVKRVFRVAIILGATITLIGILGFVLLNYILPQRQENTKIYLPSFVDSFYLDARNTIIEIGLRCVIEYETRPEVEVGSVISQSPESGAAMLRGDSVTIYVSMETQMATMPLVVGLGLAEAQEALRNAGFNDISLSYTTDSEKPDGIVTSQFPEQDTTIAVGETVAIEINRSSDIGALADLTGLDYSAALGRIARAGVSEIKVEFVEGSGVLSQKVEQNSEPYSQGTLSFIVGKDGLNTFVGYYTPAADVLKNRYFELKIVAIEKFSQVEVFQTALLASFESEDDFYAKNPLAAEFNVYSTLGDETEVFEVLVYVDDILMDTLSIRTIKE